MLIITDKKKLLEYREKRHWLEWNNRNHSHFNRLEDRRQNKHIKTSSEHDGKQKPSIFSEILQKFKEILFLKKNEKGKKQVNVFTICIPVVQATLKVVL